MTRIINAIFGFFSVMDRHGRGTEYHMVNVLALFALILLIPGDTMNWQTYSGLSRYGITETTLSAFLLSLAAVRGLALYINGYHYRTPTLRAVTSMASCLLFGVLSYNVWIEFWTGGLPQPAVTMAFYPAFVLAEFRAASRLRWERIHAAY